MADVAPLTYSPAPPGVETGSGSAGLRALDRLLAAHGPSELLAKPPSAMAAAGLTTVIHLVCAEAHRAVPGGAARMIIWLHAAWPTLPSVQHLRSREDRARLLAHVVTLAIAEFYQRTPSGG